MKKFYAIYTVDDKFVEILETKKDVMKFTKRKNMNSTYSMLRRIEQGGKTVIVDKIKYKIYEMVDDEV